MGWFSWHYARGGEWVGYDNGKPINGAMLYFNYTNGRSYDDHTSMMQLGNVWKSEDGKWIVNINASIGHISKPAEKVVADTLEDAQTLIEREVALSFEQMAKKVLIIRNEKPEDDA